MVARSKILVVDDECEVQEVVREALASRFDVVTASNGAEGIKLASSERPDLIVLDILMNGTDGWEVARSLKAGVETRHIPVIVLTGVENDELRANGLRTLVEDVVSKPFRPLEFMARVEKQMALANGTLLSRSMIVRGNLSLDPLALEARINDRIVPLSALEFNLLLFLASNIGQIFSREKILNEIWNDSSALDRVVDNHISILRRKLKGFDHEFVSIYRAGYGLKRKSDRRRH